jgi:hypothetical protein
VTVLSGYLATGSLDLDATDNGDVAGGPALDMSLVERGTLSALVVLHAETASLTIAPLWQVSLGDGVWINAVSTANPAPNVAAPVDFGADINSIALSVAGVVADADAIVLDIATDDTEGGVTLSGTDLDGLIGDGAISPTRAISITTAANAGSYNIADPITVTGTDVDGNVLVGTGTLTDADGNETIEIYGGVGQDKGFASVVSVALPAMNDTDGTISVGVLSEMLNDSSLTGLLGDGTIDPPRHVVLTTAASASSYNTDPVTIAGLDEAGDPATEDLTITDADGDETLTTTGLFSRVDLVFIPPMVDTDSSFQVGTDAGSLQDALMSLPAPAAVYGWPQARIALLVAGNDGDAVDTYEVSYNFQKRDNR